MVQEDEAMSTELCEHRKSRKTRMKGMRYCNDCGAVFFAKAFEDFRPSPWPKFIKWTLVYTTISLATVEGMIYVRALILGLT